MRALVYAGTLVVVVLASTLTLASIIHPSWLTFRSTPSITYGLHKRCISPGDCTHFPTQHDCADDRAFCSLWRSIGFLMSFSVLLEGVAILAITTVIFGGRRKRESACAVVVGFLLLVAGVQAAGMAGAVGVLMGNERFSEGWGVGLGWMFAGVSVGLVVGAAAGLGGTWAAAGGREGGYELIA